MLIQGREARNMAEWASLIPWSHIIKLNKTELYKKTFIGEHKTDRTHPNTTVLVLLVSYAPASLFHGGSGKSWTQWFPLDHLLPALTYLSECPTANTPPNTMDAGLFERPRSGSLWNDLCVNQFGRGVAELQPKLWMQRLNSFCLLQFSAPQPILHQRQR